MMRRPLPSETIRRMLTDRESAEMLARAQTVARMTRGELIALGFAPVIRAIRDRLASWSLRRPAAAMVRRRSF